MSELEAKRNSRVVGTLHTVQYFKKLLVETREEVSIDRQDEHIDLAGNITLDLTRLNKL